MTIDSLKRRYVIKFIANTASGCVHLVTQTIFPRALGPGRYGDYSYLTNFFTQLLTLVDLGVSMGLGTKLSQRPKDTVLVGFYRYVVLAITAATVLFVTLVILSPLRGLLWPGQTGRYILVAAIWGILTWLSQVLFRMMDAWALTIPSETAKIVQKVVSVAVLLLLFFADRLGMMTLFVAQNVLLAVLCVGLAGIAARYGYSVMGPWRIRREQVRAYFKEFYEYNSPLVVYGIVGVLTGIFDRWMLQVYGGNVQQGFFGLSSQIGAACTLFTAAMVPLIHREFSVAHGEKNLPLMAHLFRRYIPLLYTVAAYFSCFIVVQSENVAMLFGGRQFAAAGPALAVMAFYPIHQAYGQLSGTLFYATGRTETFRNVGLFFMLLGVPFTYWAIAPENRWGLDAGAFGLSVKTVLFQFATVNVLLFYNTRLLNLSFRRYFAHQVGSIALLLGLAALATYLASQLTPAMNSVLVRVLVSGALYTAIVALTCILFPPLFGVQRADVTWVLKKLTLRR